jgi:hypothetical protein
MQDETESIRRARVIGVNQGLSPEETERRKQLEAQYGEVYTKDEVLERWEIIGFMAPFVVVREKATGKKGSLEFSHMPRFYFNYQED